jgi:hypothetical protein
MHSDLTNEELGLLAHAENLVMLEGRLDDDMKKRLRPIMRRAHEAGAVGGPLAVYWTVEGFAGRLPTGD